MARSDPFEIIFLRGLTVSRQTRIFIRQHRKFPIWLAFIPLERVRSSSWIEGVRQRRKRLKRKRSVLGALAEKSRDGFRHQTALLSAGPTLDEHFEVELFRGQPLKRVLADRPESALIYLTQETI